MAMVCLSLFGVSLLFPHFSEKLLSPLTRFGSHLGSRRDEDTFRGSFSIGIGTGLLWAPCAGPILGIVLTGAASQHTLAASVSLLLSYSLGAATSLALALLAGNRVFNQLKKFLGWDQVIKKTLGVLVLLGVATIALHLDRTVLLNASQFKTAQLETSLLERLGPKNATVKTQGESTSEGDLPDLSGATSWLNTQPLTRESLQGKVVLIDFWTYSCINCLRSLPYIKNWAEKYEKSGLVVIGVHTPEFAFEKIVKNVEEAVTEFKIHYPVAIDSNYAIWSAFNNQYWPAHYFIDRNGKIRHHHFGEGQYEESEEVLKKLLTESGEVLHPKDLTVSSEVGVQAKAQAQEIGSPETYVGYGRAKNFISASQVKKDQNSLYQLSTPLSLNQWSLLGNWMITSEKAILKKQGGKIVFNFHARDLHLVLGSAKKTRIQVKLDGAKPGENHGTDINSEGNGVIETERLYQLIRQTSEKSIQDRIFEIEFLDSEVSAYAFTFG